MTLGQQMVMAFAGGAAIGIMLMVFGASLVLGIRDWRKERVVKRKLQAGRKRTPDSRRRVDQAHYRTRGGLVPTAEDRERAKKILLQRQAFLRQKGLEEEFNRIKGIDNSDSK